MGFDVGFSVVWESSSCVVKRHFGAVTGSELMDAVIEVHSSPDFDRLRYVINDFLDCTSLSCSDEELEEIAAIDKAASLSNSKIRIAVVASNPEIWTMARNYADSPLNVYPTSSFRTIAEARAWLGIPA